MNTELETQTELEKPTNPANFITAQEARDAMRYWTSYEVFRLISQKAENGQRELAMPWTALSTETMALLGAGEYKVRRGGTEDSVAVISW